MGRRIALVLAVWLLAAALIGGSGLWPRLPAPLAGATLGLLVAAVLVAWRRSPELARWLREVDPRLLILPHLTRLVGIEFLALFQRGRLPFGFATPAGYGDILAALGALIVAVACVPVRSRLRRAVLLLWNAFGLLDLLVARSVTSYASGMSCSNRKRLAGLRRHGRRCASSTYSLVRLRTRAWPLPPHPAPSALDVSRTCH